MKRTLCFLALNCYLGFCFYLNQAFAQMPGPPIIDTPLTTSKTYFYNGEIMVPYSNGHVSVTNNAAVNILSTTEVTLLPGFTASVDSGCEEFVARIQECPQITLQTSIKNVSCYGGNDGSITLNVNGGQVPYSFNWSPNKADSPVLFGLHSGQFTATITDKNGCITSGMYTIYEPSDIQNNISTINSNCGQNNGSATLTSSGGNNGFSYFWAFNSSLSNHQENLFAGSYDVIVSDSKACQKKIKVHISDIEGPQPLSSLIKNVTCNGGNDGSITLQLDTNSIGRGPIPGWPDCTLPDMVGAGEYPVSLTDTNGCKSILVFSVAEPPLIQISVSISPSSCNNSNGTVEVNASGGTGSLFYNWSSGKSGPLLTNISSMIDTLWVTDETGCSERKVIIVDDSDGPNPNKIKSNVTCPGLSNGSITFSPLDAYIPYSYFWLNNDGIDQTASELSAGLHSVLITDSRGCKNLIQDTITQPQDFLLDVQLQNPSFDTTNDGAIDIRVNGGTPPYTFNWSNGSNLPKLENLGTGIYTIEVIDASNCSTISSINLHPLSPYVVYSCSENTPYDYTAMTALQNSCQCAPLPPGTGPNYELDLVRDFGANPNDNISDEAAFERANDFINSYLTTTLNPLPIVLSIPGSPNPYIVGRQVLGQTLIGHPLQSHYMPGHDVLCFEDKSSISIIGYDVQGFLPSLKFEDCMLYGAFDRVTGYRYLHCPSYTVIPTASSCCLGANPVTSDPCYCFPEGRVRTAAYPGTMFSFVNCSNIQIKNINFDGNGENLKMGGYWSSVGDGIQLSNDAINLNGCTTSTVENVEARNFGRDGIMVCDLRPNTSTTLTMDIAILNSKFNNNYRNGMSWVSGRILRVLNCEFEYNGYGKWGGSSPQDGVDIEWEYGGQDLEHGYFENCRFRYNKRCGIESNISSYVTKRHAQDFQFVKCTFVSSQFGNTAWSSTRNMKYYCSDFYGPLVHAYDAKIEAQGDPDNDDNTKWVKCNFNEEYTDPFTQTTKSFTRDDDDCNNIPTSIKPFLIEISTAARSLFDNCRITTNHYNKWINITGRDIIYPRNRSIIKNCHFENYGIDWRDNIPYFATGDNRKLGEFTFCNFIGFNSTTVNAYYPQCVTAITDCYWISACPNQNDGPFPMVRTFGAGCPQVIDQPTNISSWRTCQDKYIDILPSPSVSIYNGDCCPATGCVSYETATCTPSPPSGSGNRIITDFETSKDSSYSNNYTIIPNPGEDKISILNCKNGDRLQIFNTLGNLVLSEAIFNSGETIFINKLKSGIYFTFINKHFIGKIVKL